MVVVISNKAIDAMNRARKEQGIKGGRYKIANNEKIDAVGATIYMNRLRKI